MSIEAIQEYMMFVNEINQGMKQVNQLRASSSCSPNQEAVLDKMVASYTDAASVLAGGSAAYTDAASVLAGGSSQGQAGAVDMDPLSDGYLWRKYGQKNLLGAKYSR